MLNELLTLEQFLRTFLEQLSRTHYSRANFSKTTSPAKIKETNLCAIFNELLTLEQFLRTSLTFEQILLIPPLEKILKKQTLGKILMIPSLTQFLKISTPA